MPSISLIQFAFYVTPGFLAIALYRKKYPAQKESDLYIVAWSLICSFFILSAVTGIDNILLNGYLSNHKSTSFTTVGGNSINLLFIGALFLGGTFLSLFLIA